MMCYKDMTFCSFYQDCIYKLSCKRRLTPEVKKDAQDFGLPIMAYLDKPDCFEECTLD